MLFFTSDRVGVGIVSWAVRAVMTIWKSKIAVLSRVIRATESESEESERFHFLSTPLMTPSLRSAYDLVKTRLSEAKAEAEGKANHNALSHASIMSVLPLLLATPTTYFSLDRKRWSRKWDQNAVFTRSLSPTLLITTPTLTPSLVKTSLKRMNSPSFRETEKKNYI